MCGIWAVFSKNKMGFFNQDKFDKLILGLATASQIRGTDSTGMFWLSRDNKVGELPAFYKDTLTGSLFLQQLPVKTRLSEVYKSGQAIVAHHRAATIGAVEVDNAHPFREGSITLVHNGTLRSGYTKYQVDGGSDSRALAVALDKHKKDALKDIHGAYAMIWHDADDDVLHLARNSERPLCVYEDDSYVIVASIPQIIYFGLLLANIEGSKGALKELETGVHYRWDYHNTKWLAEGEMPVPTYQYQTSTPAIGTKKYGGEIKTYHRKVQAEIVLIDEPTNKNNYVKYYASGLTETSEDFHFYCLSREKIYQVGDIISGVVDSYDSQEMSSKLRSSSIELIRAGRTSTKENNDTVTLKNGQVVDKSSFLTVNGGRCCCCNTKLDEKEASGALPTTATELKNDTYGYICGDCLDVFEIPINSRV